MRRLLFFCCNHDEDEFNCEPDDDEMIAGPMLNPTLMDLSIQKHPDEGSDTKEVVENNNDQPMAG